MLYEKHAPSPVVYKGKAFRTMVSPGTCDSTISSVLSVVSRMLVMFVLIGGKAGPTLEANMISSSTVLNFAACRAKVSQSKSPVDDFWTNLNKRSETLHLPDEFCV